MNTTLLRGVLVGGLAGLLFGFDTAVIAGTTEGIRNAFALDASGVGITVSAALWGTLAGALLAGLPGDRYGARNALKGIALLYCLSGLGCLIAWSWPALIVFRVMAGLAVGASSVLAPVYLAEIAPAERRGLMVGTFQLNIVLGILAAYLSNAVVGSFDLGAGDWQVKLGISAVPALLLLSLMFTIPDSPRWLAAKGREDEAEAVLVGLGVADPRHELDSYARAAAAVAVGSAPRLSWARHRKPILLAFAVASFNQLSGINAILYYLNDIFAAAGYDAVSADRQAVTIGLCNFVFTALALLVIDRLGRRTLLLIGSVGLTLALGGTAAVFLSGQGQQYLLALLIAFIAFFAFSQGAVIWVYISEIFPTDVRARGQALGSSTHWAMDAVIAMAFPVIAAHTRGLPFVVFAAMMAVQFVVVLMFFPETKQRSLEAIGAD
ncbi:sugar porter (SP) family MFS transporter [Sphingomonas endophytica]|uniref:Sugar porter (SP) family MFS transporter n=1 Tax=Sphingomonas endophytica TaxID=869719 RepID=A0ABR6N192_9SPHN|nr:sugar porter family MFS transporter [Sphingomonas endophytica]MBB5724558.1 sugar porter (SP) family MFS transporter [Sphingomonas endophytica]